MSAAKESAGFSHLKKYPEQLIQIDLRDQQPRSPYTDSSLHIQTSLDEQKRADDPAQFPGTVISGINPIREVINWNTGAYSWLVEANEHVVYTDYEDQIYPGALIKGNSVENFDFNPVIGYTPKPISVSVSLPAPAGKVAATIDIPSLSATTRQVNNVLLNSQFAQLGFAKYNLNIKEFTYYDELKELFATGKNTNLIFFNSSSGTTTNIKKISRSTGLMAKFIQKNFTIDMDIPKAGQLIDLNVDPNIIGAYSPLYVSSVTYGRLGIITVESDAGFDELKKAFEKAFGILGIVNGSNTLTQEEINTINSADIKIYLVGGLGAQAVQTINGYQNFLQYLGGGQTFSAQAPGVPITFNMRYLSDHSAYKAQFQINYGNIEKVYARIEFSNQRNELSFPSAGSTRETTIEDIYLAFYQDVNCTKSVKASNVIQFDYSVTLSKNSREPGVTTTPVTTTTEKKVKNTAKGTRILLEKDKITYSKTSKGGRGGSFYSSSYHYVLRSGNGYTTSAPVWN